MKSLFNVIALGIDTQTAITKAVYGTLAEKGHVLVNLVKDLREGLEASDLPRAFKDYVKVATTAPTPKWVGELVEETEKLTEAFNKTFDDKANLKVVPDDTTH